MKILCDVCDRAEASLFCPSDEAALCYACDRTIHHANKLSRKHYRFSLHHPSSNFSPLCDICQERRAYLFCKEDRAILCRECDIPIHRASEHTRKHNRFLLTGVKISASTSSSDSQSNVKRHRSSFSSENAYSSMVVNSSLLASATGNGSVEDQCIISKTSSVLTSSISEYLIEKIPGYCFEDLLDASSFPPPNGFC
ncbi:B-box zinc finger protein 20-like [Prosopis cineraria]|uniref:B-box zinc finger protein 20-like n=1 Tax=Prosopis cineraria TaxID=364024 RepID=UPI00240ECC35|nr:B-box zinc finger protein 20-like [Prosopis cineraria]XP_054776443.1 B-box zinc finger protein 20-like [Prosopis cineraria]